jgi:transposase
MADATTFVGLDVHLRTFAVAVARRDRPIEDRGIHEHTPKSLERVLRRIGPLETLWVCYEAGPCGFAPYRQLTSLGVRCTVVAPALIPKPAGKRVKTDRIDAARLAQVLRNGEAPAIHTPSPDDEALRDLCRLREAALGDLHRARQRLAKFLHRKGIVEPAKPTRWMPKWWAWLDTVVLPLAQERVALQLMRTAIGQAQTQLDDATLALETAAAAHPLYPVMEALDALHGVGLLTAITLVAEVGDFRRFDSAREVMGYVGLVPSEHSSGERQRRGGITKTGNARLRRVTIEAAWHYVRAINPLPDGTDPAIVEARARLHRRYHRLVRRGKPAQVAVVAIARELLGFVWAVACQATQTLEPTAA